MGQRKDLEARLIGRLKDVLEGSGFSAELVPSDITLGESVLLIMPKHMGDREEDLQVEVSFLPETEEDIKELNFNVLHIFSCIKENISFSTCDELARVVLKLNPQIPGGAFGIDEKGRSLYYKSSCIITDNMDEKVAFSLMEVYLGIFLNTLDRHIDVLMDINDGLRTAEDAIKKGIV